MTTEKWKPLQEQEIAYLDTIDLSRWLNKDASIGNIMDEIENRYNEAYKVLTGDEFIFNFIDQEEFSDYLRKRYDIHTYEHTELRIL